MHYFKRTWSESRGDKYDSWGASQWWFETDEEGYITRNLQVYQNGTALFYNNRHVEDEYGILPEDALSLSEFKDFSVSREDFEQALSTANPING